ncbi:MAG: ABC transporter ATP-binding protein/permease [Firmicutes bacterium]|nr:ABC transporter ATP-binding protein/permease [Bacillota bacterium]
MGIYKKYFNKYKWPFLIAVVCVAFEAVCDLLGPTLMANIIDLGIQPGMMAGVLHWGGLMLLVTLVGAGFAITRNILSSQVSQRFGADLRYDCFSKIMGLSEAGADQIESGSLITRMTNDTTQVVQFINGTMRVFIKAPITCVGSIVLASIRNFRLSVIIYGVVAIIALLIFFSMKLSYPRFTLLQRAMDRVNTIVQEYLIGVRLVKAFGTYPEETERFDDANTNLMRRGVSAQRIITVTSPMITFAVGIGTGLVLYFGGKMFSSGQIAPDNAGNISALILYMAQMLTSLMMLTNIFNTFVRTRASTARIKEMLDCEDDFSVVGDAALGVPQHTPTAPPAAPDIPSAPAAAPPVSGGAPPALGVEFRHVTFTYPNGSGVPAVRDIDLSVEPGESLAIIGPTGSGKSTLCWLLLRFYDVGSGSILLGGEDIRSLPVNELRQSVALVPQKAMLFSGTVEDNIRWGDPSADETAIRRAAEDAQAEGFIEQMPEGYESLLSGAAVNISGGQKQRISIARGLIKRAPVLVLDDATSALDSITEAKIRTRLFEKSEGQTVILITQRCTTAMFADKILVLENGVPTGFGAHSELMEASSTYRELYRSQVDSSAG